MIKGLIFDLDGTVLDTVLDLKEAVSYATNSSPTNEKIMLTTGNGFRKLVERNMINPTAAEVDEALIRFKEKYKSCYMDKTTPYEGIKDLLKELQDRNYLLAINSNKDDTYTKNLIHKHFNDIEFVDIIGSREKIPNKPDPFSVYELIQKMNLKKDEVIYIGDSQTDILTAKNSGLISIGCLWGFRKKEDLLEVKADYLVDKPLEILKIIENKL